MPVIGRLALGLVLGILSVANAPLASAQVFRQTMDVGLKDPMILNIALSRGDVIIAYNRDGQVSISAYAQDAADNRVSEEFFRTGLLIAQKGSEITIRESPKLASTGAGLSISYRIDVPFRTQTTSSISGSGNQTLVGTTGPAKLTTSVGNIEAMEVSFAPVQATTGKGNISCSRDLQVEAETGEGNITLMETGSSQAVVKKGLGRIEVGGARGSFEGWTDRGDLHIKAVLHDNWQLNSASGNIRVELPPRARFALAASTLTGEISIEREGMQKPTAARPFHQEVNGGGKRIQINSTSGNIFIQ